MSNQGRLDKLERRVYARMDKGVPFELWDHDEQMYHAWYITGQRCPSSPTVSTLQVTETRHVSELPD